MSSVFPCVCVLIRLQEHSFSRLDGEVIARVCVYTHVLMRLEPSLFWRFLVSVTV